MSKAFTREDDNSPDEPIRLPPSASLPPGVKNYFTPDGERRVREELNRFIQVERPRLLALPNQEEARRDLQILDQRIAYLHGSLQSAEVVHPPPEPVEQVRFGAFVTVRDRAGLEATYRLVGVDELDLDRGWISWRSPLARALLNSKVGQRVRFRTPAGDEELEIVRICYE